MSTSKALSARSMRKAPAKHQHQRSARNMSTQSTGATMRSAINSACVTMQAHYMRKAYGRMRSPVRAQKSTSTHESTQQKKRPWALSV